MATFVVACAAAPAPARAQSLPLTPGDLLGQGLGETISGLACDPVRQVTQPLGELAAGVSDLLCSAGLLDYTVYTVYKRPDGTLVKRETQATLVLPTLVEVGDGDILPDLLVTITPLSTDRLRLRIDRMLLQGPIPVSVEAVAKDPTAGSLPRQRVAFGYDGRATTAPQSFETEIRVGNSATEAGATTLGIGYETRGAGASLDVIGGIFNGTPQVRTDPIGVRMNYAPVPQEAGVELVIGKRLAVRKTASSPTKLTLDAEAVEGASELRARGVVDLLPAWTEVIYEPLAPDRRNVTYTAAAPVSRFTLDYTDKPGGVLSQAATVKASGLPTGMALAQTSKASGTFATTGGALGSVEVGYARNGLPRLLPGAAGPYGYVFEEGTLASYAGRIDGLTRASFAGTDEVIHVDAEIAARTPFLFKVDTPTLTADGDLQDLPRHVNATVDLNAGKIDYDGFGETIDRITLAEARKPAGFFPTAKPPLNRVNLIRGTVRQLPPKVTVTLKPESEEGAGFTASQAIGSLEALLSSGPDLTLPAGETGVRVEDVPAHFTAFGRVNGLREVNVKTGPDRKLNASAKLARQKLHVLYRSILKAEPPATPPGDTTVDARLSEIPDSIGLALDPVTGTANYVGSQGIDSLDATVTAENPLFKRARRIDARVTGIPASLDLLFRDLPNDGFGAGFRATPQVGSIDVLMSDRADATLAGAPLPAGESGVVYRDLPDTFTIHGRVNGLRAVGVVRAPSKVISATALIDPQKLHAIYEAPLDPAVAGSPTISLDARTSVVPSSMNLSFDPTAGKASYSANAGIETLDATMTSSAPLFGQVKRIFAHVEGIPAALNLGFKPPSGDGGSFTADTPVRLIEAELTDGGPADRFPDGRSGVKLTNFPGQFKMFGRLREVKGATFTSSNGNVKGVVDTGPLPGGAPQPFDIEALFARPNGSTQPPSKVETKISNLPGHVEVDQGAAKIAYSASDPISTIDIDAFDLNGQEQGKINRVDATLTGVPKKFTIDMGDKNGVTVEDGSFQKIQASLWDTGSPIGAPPEDGRNKALMNTRDGQLKVFLRIFGLKKAVLSEGFGNTIVVDTAFAAPPAPLDFQLLNKAGTPAIDSSVDVTAKELPTEARISVGDAGTVQGQFMGGTVLGYDANGSTADVHAEIRTPGAVALLDSPDIPAHSHVCFASGFQCAAKADQVFNTEDDDINGGTDPAVFFNDVNIVTDTDGLLRLSGKICLPPTNDKGTPTGAPAPYDCAPNTTHFITLDEFRVKNTRFEFASGNASNEDDDGGGPGEDGLLKLYLDSDATGIKVRDFRFVNTSSNDVMHIQKDADPPFRNMIVGSPFFLVIDLDTNFTPFDEPDIEQYNGQQIDCRNLTVSPKILGEELDVIPVLLVFQALPGIPDICVG